MALRTLISALRAAGRRPGASRHPLAGRAALDRCLAATPDVSADALVELKTLLRDLVRADGEDTDLAVRAAHQLQGLCALPLAPTDRVEVRLEGRPPQLHDTDARALLGDFECTASDAALAVHRLDGQVVGGQPLRVVVALPDGRSLPAVPRHLRGDRGRWGRSDPWLPHLDDVGRRSLTPLGLAERMAGRVTAARVVDACCGCGGNAVAFARAGLQVTAVELDGHRARLARENARARGVSERVRVVTGSVEAHLDALLSPGVLLFVDPPWVPDGADRATTFDTLFSRLPRLAEAIASWPQVMLKLPRAFDVRTLPGGPDHWTLRYERGCVDTGDARVVRMITAMRRSG